MYNFIWTYTGLPSVPVALCAVKLFLSYKRLWDVFIFTMLYCLILLKCPLRLGLSRMPCLPKVSEVVFILIFCMLCYLAEKEFLNIWPLLLGIYDNVTIHSRNSSEWLKPNGCLSLFLTFSLLEQRPEVKNLTAKKPELTMAHVTKSDI